MGSFLNFVFLKDTHEFNGDSSFAMEGPIFHYIKKREYSYTLNGELKDGFCNILLIETNHKLESINHIPDSLYDFINTNNIKLLITSIPDPCNINTFNSAWEYINTKLPIEKFDIIDSNTRLSDKIYSLNWFLEEGVWNYEIYTQKEKNDLGYISEQIEKTEIYKFRNKKFLCFNRSVDKEHRISLFHEYLLNDYSDSYFTFLIPVDGFAKVYFLDTYNYDKEYYNKHIPVELDTHSVKDKTNFKTSNTNKKELFLDSCINLVTETSFDENELFISEKIIKPIINYQPFIVFSAYGYLKKLKSYGFKTFSDIWDESYDDIVDSKERFFKLLGLVRDLNSKSIEELNEIYKKCIDICIYNKEHFHSLKSDTLKNILIDIESKWKNKK
jgi:hypothetical protein